MKRGGPLRRGKPLRAKQGLARSGKLAQTQPLKATPLQQRSPKRYKPPQELLAWAIELSATWRRYTVRSGVCACCGLPPSYPDEPLEAHHVLPKEYIKRYVRALQLTPEARYRLQQELVWDKRNGMPLRRSCHARHTKAVKRVDAKHLQPQHLQFASALGMLSVLDRQYTGGIN